MNNIALSYNWKRVIDWIVLSNKLVERPLSIIIAIKRYDIFFLK